MSTMPPLTQSIGQAEDALRAILDRLLVEPDLTYEQWVALSLIARGETPLQQDHVIQQLVAVLKREPGTVLDDLIARELVTAPASDPSSVTLTAHGDAQVRRVRQHIAQVIERVYGDLPQADLVTTHRVLGMIAERAGRELER